MKTTQEIITLVETRLETAQKLLDYLREKGRRDETYYETRKEIGLYTQLLEEIKS